MAAKTLEGHVLDELMCLQLDCFRRAVRRTDAEEIEFLETMVARLDSLFNFVHSMPSSGRSSSVAVKRRKSGVQSLVN